MAGKTPKMRETKTEKALASIGSEKYARFMEKFAPLEREFLGDIADQREERRAQRGMASTDMAIAASGVRKQAGEALPQGGTALGLADTATETGQAVGLNRAQLGSDLDKQYVGDLQAATSRGLGISGQAVSGLSSAAQAAAARAAEDVRAKIANKQAKAQAIGMLVGNFAQSALSPKMPEMSASGVKQSWNQPGQGTQQFGLTTFPYPGA